MSNRERADANRERADADRGSADMTLAFELEALRSLSDPNAAFTDARGWTRYVGVVSEKPTYVVTNYTRKQQIRQDFFSGPRGVRESLESVATQFDTDRHVFVGTSSEDEALAAAVGWEYRDVHEAAEAAGWELEGEERAGSEAEEDVREDWP